MGISFFFFLQLLSKLNDSFTVFLIYVWGIWNIDTEYVKN